MNTALWVAQALVAVTFLLTGALKAFRHDVAKKNQAFARVMPKAFVMSIGVLEILGGVGLLVPSLTGILPKLSVLAAGGLCLLMTGAIGTHLRLNEPGKSVGPLILLGLRLFIAYGRQVLVPL